MRDEHLDGGARAARARPASTTSTRRRSAATARRAQLYNFHVDNAAGVLMSHADGWHARAARVGHSSTATRSPRSSAPRARASTTSAASAPSGALPHFDDLLFLGASVSRYPLEGYRERCDTDVILGTRFAKKPLAPEDPGHDRRDELRRALGAGQGGARPRRQRGRHLDDHRRRRHDARGARALEARSSTSSCPRATG